MARVGFNPKGGRIKTDARVTIDRAYLAHLEFSAAQAAAASAAGALALTSLGEEAQDITVGITNPAVPRGLSVVGNVSGIVGNVKITGTNIIGEEITETLALNEDTPVNGAKAFKTITKVELPEQVHTPTAQVETVAVTNQCTQDGVIVVTVTSEAVTKAIIVPVTTAENTSALVAAEVRAALEADEDVTEFFEVGGTGANVVLTALTPAANDVTLAIAMVDAPDVGVTVGASENTTAGVDGAAQVETVEVTHAANVAGTLTVRVVSAGIGSTVNVAVPVVGTKQVETATVLGTIQPAGAGDANVIVTANGMGGSPKTVVVAVANDDSASVVGGKIRTALGIDGDVSAFFDVSGADAEVILTAKTAAADDATMNIAIDNDSCLGLTPAPTSENTTPGVAPDSINSVATKIRAALTSDPDVGDFFTISGADANIVLTAKVEAANDGTLAITLPADDGTGVTFGASANTTPGVAPVLQVETIEVLTGSDSVGTVVFTVTANGMGSSPKSVNVNVTADDDTASAVATKARAALGADADVSAFFTIGGAGGNIVLTAIEAAADDGTMLLAMTDTPSTGVTFGASANTTPGVDYDKVSVGFNDILGLPYLLAHNTVIAASLNNVRETTAPTVTVSATALESNTVDLHSALDGSVVDIYLIC